ncbi:hypothetical protein [Thalassovita sp.]|uniref:MotE family protein n=1 Tax=Thalassovita sp. TaxID=1979401 RepID=UPI0029DE5440|nr:hypothetical protein [Thalassovita sp.]
MSLGRKRDRKRAGKGSLAIIACLLIGSAVVRTATSAGEAWAKTAPPQATHAEDAQTDPAAECTSEDDLRTVLEALENRKKRLDDREKMIARRMDALAEADREIATRLQEMTRTEEELSRTLAIADQAAEKDISRLVSVYENMKPKDAAALFEEMDPNFAAGFLARMNPESAAGVMAGLSPQVAYTLSVVLAGRNAEAPRN